jgi:hypothetical protein
MRVVLAILAVLMAVFGIVQYNDPDGLLWALYYSVPAVWAALAAYRPSITSTRVGQGLLALTAAVAVGLTYYYWPPGAGWWRQEVWSMSLTEEHAARMAEQSREGMGIMIATAVVLVVLAASFSARSREVAGRVSCGGQRNRAGRTRPGVS